LESDQVYAAVGKMIVDAAFMEWTAAQLVAALNGENRSYAEDLCRRGRVMRELKKAAESDTELSQLYTEIIDLRERRHELAHSVGMVASDGRGREIFLYFRPLRDDEPADERDDLIKYPGDILDLAREIGVTITHLVHITQERSDLDAM
jgi:hypothetical protein